MIFPPLSNATTLRDKLAGLERRDLDGVHLQFPQNLSFLADFSFLRLERRLALLEGVDASLPVDLPVCTLLSSLYSLNLPFCYLLDGEPERINVLMGTQSSAGAPQRAVLEGYWGSGCCGEAEYAGERVSYLSDHSLCGALTGIPSVPRREKRETRSCVPASRWIRALWGRRWSFMVCGYPIPRATVSGFEDALIAEIALQRTGTSRSEILLAEQRLSEQYLKGVEHYLKRLSTAGSGVWQVGVYFFAANESDVRQGLGLLCADFTGTCGQTQPLRVHLCRKDSSLPPSAINLLTTTEAANLITIPDQESPGFTVQKAARFDSDIGEPTTSHTISIGNVVKDGVTTGISCSIPIDDLTRHGLIAGVTGSGKTTTCIGILCKLREQGVPFLVVESAKSEYRHLLTDPAFNDLLIFTLGDETPGSSAPFRMNPFEVPEGILVQSHLDYLKSLFRASFVMYAPMPYVLEEALHEVYRDKGWNLSANSNPRGRDPLAFPTLSDLYNKIGEVVARTGYDERISKDILAGLRTRINNLRLGAKGLMLDTWQSVPIDELLRRPVVLELHRIGNDDEKAFLIGLLLTRIYEHYEAGAQDGATFNGLRHLTLIEEAHRLLKHVPEEASEMEGNVRGKAVETFCAMLSEIRAFGEGVLVAEQIPTKLSRDVLKNTNLKVMHRMVARDDRDMLGDTMNLSDAQKRHATTLERGSAIVYAEGMDSPYLVSVATSSALVRRQYDTTVTGAVIHDRMEQQFYLCYPHLLRPLAACGLCNADAGTCSIVRQAVVEVAVENRMTELFNRLFFSLAFSNQIAAFPEELDRLLPMALRGDEAQCRIARRCLLSQAAFSSVEGQGRLYAYPFRRMHELLTILNRCCNPLVGGSHTEGQDIVTFRNILTALRRSDAVPFVGCSFCHAPCLYRYEVGGGLHDERLNADFSHAISDITDDNEMWRELADLAKRSAYRLVPEEEAELINGLVVCYLAQKTAHNGYAPRIQEKVVRNCLAAIRNVTRQRD